MSLELWFAFAIAAFVLQIIPGPTIILVISQAITHGRKVVLPLVLGVTLGDLTAMTLSLAGLGAIMASSAALFGVLKWIGAVYLVYLGLKLWCAHPESRTLKLSAMEPATRSVFRNAYIVTALNPKGIAFFVAFLPHFISPRSEPLLQFMILGTTFLVLAAINVSLYALFAGQLHDTMQNATIRRWFNRCGGTALIGAGFVTATLQRSS